MGSQAQSHLPIIEFNETNSTPGTSSWKTTSDSVRQALESYGCFVISDRSFSSELHEEIFRLLSEELFVLPLEIKRKNTSEIPGSGYGGNYSIMPLFEYLAIEDCETLEAAEKFTSLLFSDGHDKFRETIYSYSKILLDLDHKVMKMVFSSYGLEKYYDPFIQTSLYLTRLMRYQSPGENESGIGIIPHRDKSLMSVIGTNEVKGLQIENPNGDWVDFEPSIGKFIVIAGEAFTAWSNGRIYSPLHKVIAGGTKEKYSIALFSFSRGILQVPEELVDDDENKLKFKSFNHLEFIEYCKEGGPKMITAIQAYCGI
ncbi:Iron/ascorbate family oxidoreductase [Handroanthus impetiginosus]|uniref:Iron/ascorbate family oxidoreductase n=1 Tax=Handroanthus impetiginosus TaxID=429701 RepID=A0A2G9GXA1_9LAMI|nr:Iron/ascorbate family oxidoreductase [Handroanthus impetiginosus]